jgi:hypothetical protein
LEDAEHPDKDFAKKNNTPKKDLAINKKKTIIY